MAAPFLTKIFADGADLDGILALARDPRISGFTTNPTLMRQAGVTNYVTFARRILEQVPNHPISFEVTADEVDSIRRQARTIASWGENVYVKIPVTTTDGHSLASVARELSESGVKVNVTAMFTLEQVGEVTKALSDGAPSYMSIFAGRIADAGVDPVPLIAEAVSVMTAAPRAECVWAWPREVFNVIQANHTGCHIITMTHDLLKKMDGLGKDLTQLSRETVQMFFRDAATAGYEL